MVVIVDGDGWWILLLNIKWRSDVSTVPIPQHILVRYFGQL